MQVKSLVLGAVRTNCHIVIDERLGKCLIIDPADNAEKIAELLAREGLTPVAILLTHGHFDHIYAASELASRFRLPILAGEKENELLQDTVLNESRGFGREGAVVPTRLLRDGENVEISSFRFKVIATPGHTEGSVCYYFEEQDIVFTGDTLFFESVGRTDLHTGNSGKLIRSIKDKLFELPKHTYVFTGHGPKTSIEHEIRNNPYV